MRILYLPMWGLSRDITRSSEWHWARRFFRMLVERYSDVFLYFCVPEHASGEVLEALAHDRILAVPITLGDDQYQEMTRIPDRVVELFNDPDGRYYLDVVVCDKVAGLAYARAVLANPVEPYQREPIWCAVPQFLIDRHIQGIADSLRRAYAMGLLAADICYWGSDYMEKRGVAFVQKRLGLAAAADVQRKSKLGIWGIDTEKIDQVTVDITKPSDVTLFNWGYGLTDEYHVNEVMQAWCLAIGVTNAAQGVVCSSARAPGMTVDQELLKIGELHLAFPQDEFFRKAARAHVFVYYPERVEVVSTVHEQQWMGQVGILRDVPGLRAMCYPDYPYFFRQKAQLPGMLHHLARNYWSAEVQDVVERQRGYIRSRFRLSDQVDRFYRDVEKAWCDRVEGTWRGRKASIRQLYAALAKFPVLHESEWSELVVGLSDMGMGPRHHYRTKIGKSCWRDLMLLEGWTDDCQEADPVFRRVKESDADLGP